MLSKFCVGVLLVCLLSACALCDVPLPTSTIFDRPDGRPEDGKMPPPLGPYTRPELLGPGDPYLGSGIPDSTLPRNPSVPSSPFDIQPGPQVPPPKPIIPSPVAPSETPTGALAVPSIPVTPAGTEFIQTSGDYTNTTFDEDGSPLLTVAEGNVIVRFRDFEGTSDRAQVDYNTNLITFQGNVKFKIGVQEASGGDVVVNYRTREWSVASARTTIVPEFAQGWLQAPVFADARRIQGIGQRQVDVLHGEATTCNLPLPHYQLRAKSVSVYPNDKAVLRDVAAYALGHRLFTLPRIVIPLRQIQNNPQIIPRVGQTLEEGFFLKTQYALSGSRNFASFLLLDLMSKKGVGTGLNQTYRLGSGAGTMQLYQLQDRNTGQSTLTGRFSHIHQIGGIKAGITTDLRSNSYLYASQSKTLNTQLTISRDVPDAATSLVVNQNINDAFQRTSRLAGNLKHHQRFGPDSDLDAALDYTALTTTATQARLTSQGQYNKREKLFDWSISARKFTDLSDEAFVTGGGFGGIEKLPEIGVMTDTTRLGHTLLGIPARLRMTYGDYTELPNPESLRRGFFEANTPLLRYKLSNTWQFAGGAGFKQYAYSDDTAQYSWDTSAELAKNLGPKSLFRLTYRYQEPRGFTPFRFDYVGRYNIANASLNYQESKLLRFSLISGYNFAQESFPWQDIVLRMSIQPSPSLLVYTATGYDINRSRWRTLINQVRIRASDQFKLDLGTRYDTTIRQLADARLVLNTQLGKLWNLQANAGYNGISNSFDYRSIMLTRDLHCWEASITYIDQSGFYENKGIQLNLRIKAFPFFRDYGAGSFGQTLDTSVGNIY